MPAFTMIFLDMAQNLTNLWDNALALLSPPPEQQ